MVHCFIERWIKCDGEFKYVQLVKNEKFSRIYSSQVMPVSALYDMCKDDNCYCNFKLGEDNLLYSNITIPIVELPEASLRSMDTPAYVLTPACRTVYDLFDELMDAEAYLVYDPALDHLDSIEDYVTKFIPQYSQSSMTVYVTALKAGEWRSKRIIYAEGKQLKVNNFFVAVQDPKPFKDLKVVKEVTLFGKSFTIMEYKSTLPIYVYDASSIWHSGALINYYAYMSLLSKNCIFITNQIRKHYCEEPPDVTISNSTYTKKMTLSNNIGIKHSIAGISRAEFVTILTDIVQNLLPKYLKLKNDGVITLHIRNMDSMRQTIYRYILLLRAKTRLFEDKMSLLELCDKEIDIYMKSKSKYDAFLYAFRVDAFTHGSNVCDGLVETFTGGPIPSYTRMTRRTEVL